MASAPRWGRDPWAATPVTVRSVQTNPRWAVHPTLPYVLSSSDDMLIKLWDWEKGWICTQIFEGHSHYVMQVTFNPKDTNTFASASLDRTIKVYTCVLLASCVLNFLCLFPYIYDKNLKVMY